MASKREKIKMKSKSGYTYYTMKNKVNTPDRLVRRKFDPKTRQHEEFKETK